MNRIAARAPVITRSLTRSRCIPSTLRLSHSEAGQQTAQASKSLSTVLISSVSAIAGAGVAYSLLNEDLRSSLPFSPSSSNNASAVTVLAEDPYLEELKFKQDNLEITKALRADPDMVESQIYAHLQEKAIVNNLTAGVMRAKGRIAVKPLMFYNQDKTECTVVMHLGRSLCGHDGIVHGGMLATILDEMLAVVTIPHLPNHTGFTANLNINYRAPVRADQFVVVRGKFDRVEGRKGYGSARIEGLDGKTLFAEATSLYVSPKYRLPMLKF